MALNTIKELSSKLESNYFNLRRLVIRGEIQGKKIGKQWFIDDSEIEKASELLSKKKSQLSNEKYKEIKTLENFIGLSEACKILNISKNVLKNLIFNKEITGYRSGRYWLIEKNELDKFLLAFHNSKS